MAWVYKLRSRLTSQKRIFSPRSHLFVFLFFLSSVFAAEIPALEVLAISVYHAAAPPETFLAYLAYTVVANIPHWHLRPLTLHCPLHHVSCIK
jgi:hypothetical protein